MTTDSLAGARVLLTGATGFLGQAVLERLLADHPQTGIVLVVRGRAGTSAEERLRRLLAKPVFGPWRERVGADEAQGIAASRISVVEADISREVPAVPSDVTAVIHCASTVSFDPPIDEAFRTNVQGTINLYEGVLCSGATPHLVHVSTAYVAGTRRGMIDEASLDHDVDWRAELDAALAARDDVERASRRPETLRGARQEALEQHRKAGAQATATATEERRREMVTERLVDYGGERARSLGWPDVYTLSKALGERVAEEYARPSTDASPAASPLPLSIVRPAIVESALEHPYAGWIDGFKMADPLILAFGRGTLPEFPGIPDGIVDIVPVDLVANALRAAAARAPAAEAPAYYHVGSGSRNPLTFRRFYELVRDYFERYPLPDPEGRGTVKAPQWNFPGAARLEFALRGAERAAGAAEEALLRLPGSERTRDWQRRLHRRQRDLDFLRRYSDLYGAYVEIEVIYTDDRTLALHRALPPGEQAHAGFDSAVVDWAHYIEEVHCPTVTSLVRGAPGRQAARPEAPLPDDPDIAAVFDLEGTVLASNMVETYLCLRLLDAPPAQWPGELLSLARSLPGYLRADRRDRGEFLRRFLRRYEGADEAELRRLVQERLGDLLLRRSSPQAIRRVRRHRDAGHRTVLVTGTVDVLVEPLRDLFDEVVASRLHVVDGCCTGYLDRPPVIGEARAAWVRRWAEDAGVQLPRSWAYGDDYSDRPLLELVGNPVAVNPDSRLYRHAKRRRWPVEQWDAHVRGAGSALAETMGHRR